MLLAFIGLSMTARAQDDRRDNPTSKIYIADTKGVSVINTGTKIETLTPKSVFSAEGVIIETEPTAEIAAVLSNGSGLAFDPDTRLELRRFMQEPFTPNRTDLDSEPSISQTSIFLARGALGICTSKMVAGSTTNYATRHASVAVHGRKVVIETSDDSTIVSAIEGEATIRGDLAAGGQSIKAGEQAVITRKSSTEPPVVVIRPIPEADTKRIGAKVSGACMARKSVYFEQANRLNLDASKGIFNPSDGTPGGEIIPVTVIPGKIPPGITISPYKK